MDSFEINKIIAAVIVTILIVIGISKVSDYLFYIDQPSVAAYVVDAPEKEGQLSLTGSESEIDISALLALGTVEHGQTVFKNVNLAIVLKRVVKITLVLNYGM